MWLKKINLTIIFFIALIITPSSLLAGPSGGSVVSGNANITTNGQNTVINQHTDKAIINWNQFNIGANESVRFNQLNSNSIVLNRVTGGTRSEIFGNLSANGRVFLLNNNGILIGNGANINVGSFLASTGQMSDKDFLNGKYIINSAMGEIHNYGNINVSSGGYAVLLSRKIVNEGVIAAYLGRIDIASGESFRLNFFDNKLIGIDIDKGTAEGYISNSGLVNAEGGTVFIAAKGMSSLLEATVNNDGVIKASSFIGHGGKVIIVGSNAKINNNGTIDVSSSMNGGSVSITGDSVNLNGEINANGNRGGIIFVDSVKETNINAGAKVSADGRNEGGGNIKLLSRDMTRFLAGSKVSATSIYGRGGFFELSAVRKLIIEGKVDLKSLHERGGHFYIDPMNIIISATGGTDNQYTTFISLSDLQQQLIDNVDVTISTQAGPSVGDIEYNGAGFARLTGGVLTLNAANNILITNPNMNLAGLVLEAGRDITIKNDAGVTTDITLGTDGFKASLYGVFNSDIPLSSALINISNSGTDTVLKQLNLNTSLDITTGGKLDVSTTNTTVPVILTVANIKAKEVSLTASGDISNRVDAGTLSTDILKLNARSIDLINIDAKDITGEATRSLFISNDVLSNVVIRNLLTDNNFGLVYEQTNGGLLTIESVNIPTNSTTRITNTSGYIEMPFKGVYDRINGNPATGIVANPSAVQVTAIGTTLLQKESIGEILITQALSQRIRNILTVVYEAEGNIAIDSNYYRVNDGLILKARNGSIRSIGSVGFLSLHAEASGNIDIAHFFVGAAGNPGEFPSFSGISTNGTVSLHATNVPLKILTLKSRGDSNVFFTNTDRIGVVISNVDVGGNLNLNLNGTLTTPVAISGIGDNDLRLRITMPTSLITSLSVLANKNISITGMASVGKLDSVNLTSLLGNITLDTDTINVSKSASIIADKYIQTANRLTINVDVGTATEPGTAYVKLNDTDVNINSPVADINGNNLSAYLKDDTSLDDVNSDKTSLSGNIKLLTQDGAISRVTLTSSATLDTLTTNINTFIIGGGDKASETILTVKNLNAIVIGSISGLGAIYADTANITAAFIGGPDFNPTGAAPLDPLNLYAKTARLEINGGNISPTTRTIFLRTGNAFESLFSHEFISGGEAWIIDDINNRAMLVNKAYYILLNKTRDSYLFPTKSLINLAMSDTSLYDSLLQIGGDMVTSDIRYPRFVTMMYKTKTKLEIK